MYPAAAPPHRVRAFRPAGWGLALGLLTAPLRGNEPSGAQTSAPDFYAGPDLEVVVWAETPLLYNPSSIDVDARGRVWVAEAVNYRQFPGGASAGKERLHRAGGDRIVILEDTNGDGVADSSKVFVQDRDLVAPLGVAVIGNKVIVSCSPHLIVYTDETGNDQPDKKEILLTGFGGFDHDHGLHSLVAGPDGRWYFTVGNAGPHRVTDQQGWTLRSGSSYNAGSPYQTNNVPGLVSDDGRIWTGGLALRVNPDGTGLSVLAHNFRNSYEVAVDSFGSLWQGDNDDEVQSSRVTWVMEGGNLGYFSSDGSRVWKADRRPGQSIQTAHWRQDSPGVIPAGDIYGAGAPAGLVVYEGDLLPPRYHGMILTADAARNTVFGHAPQPRGAGYRFERTVFLSSRQNPPEDSSWRQASLDERTWFRPSDVAVGTDGAVYVADWHDPVAGGHAAEDRAGQGRILRVIPSGGKVTAPPIALDTLPGQLAALASPAINVRGEGWERLRDRGEEALPHLLELYRSGKPALRARALWLMGHLGEEGRARLKEAFHDEEARIRVTAFRVARQLDLEILERAAVLVRDPSPAVRREAAIALRDYSFSQTQELLLALAARYDGEDRWYLEAFGQACEGKEEEIYPLLLARFGQPDPVKWSEGFANLVWRLRPRGAIEDLVKRARSPALPTSARHRAIDTLGFSEAREAAAAMVQLASHDEEAIQAAAGWWAQFRAGNTWKDFPVMKNFQTPAVVQLHPEQTKASFLRATLLNPDLSLELRTQTAAQLAATREGGLLLLQLAAQKKLPAAIVETVAEHIYANPDLGIRGLASQHFPRRGNAGPPFPSVASLLEHPADAARGRELFFGGAGSCSQCHQVAGAGSGFGPDLTDVPDKFNRESLFEAILNPHAKILPGYEAWLITTRNNECYSGVLVADGDPVVLRKVSGGEWAIPAGQIAQREKQKASFMPDSVALGLTAAHLADLVEFLMTPGAGTGGGRPARAENP